MPSSGMERLRLRSQDRKAVADDYFSQIEEILHAVL
jgi:hypothetical protein